MEEQPDLYNFLYQKHRYNGEFTLEHLAFNANLQEFATQVDYICNLETVGKLSVEDAYKQINVLWERLERSYLELGIDSSSDQKPL
jgi:hypothetical protein